MATFATPPNYGGRAFFLLDAAFLMERDVGDWLDGDLADHTESLFTPLDVARFCDFYVDGVDMRGKINTSEFYLKGGYLNELIVEDNTEPTGYRVDPSLRNVFARRLAQMNKWRKQSVVKLGGLMWSTLMTIKHVHGVQQMHVGAESSYHVLDAIKEEDGNLNTTLPEDIGRFVSTCMDITKNCVGADPESVERKGAEVLSKCRSSVQLRKAIADEELYAKMCSGNSQTKGRYRVFQANLPAMKPKKATFDSSEPVKLHKRAERSQKLGSRLGDTVPEKRISEARKKALLSFQKDVNSLGNLAPLDENRANQLASAIETLQDDLAEMALNDAAHHIVFNLPDQEKELVMVSQDEYLDEWRDTYAREKKKQTLKDDRGRIIRMAHTWHWTPSTPILIKGKHLYWPDSSDNLYVFYSLIAERNACIAFVMSSVFLDQQRLALGMPPYAEIAADYCCWAQRFRKLALDVPAKNLGHFVNYIKKMFEEAEVDLMGPIAKKYAAELTTDRIDKHRDLVEGMEHPASLDSFISYLESCDASIMIDVGMIYKIFPPVSSHMGHAMANMHKKSVEAAQQPVPDAHFKYCKMLKGSVRGGILRCLYSMQGVKGITPVPQAYIGRDKNGKPENRTGIPPAVYRFLTSGEEINFTKYEKFLCFRGARRRPERDAMDPEYHADKVLGYETLEEAEDFGPKKYKTMFEAYLFNPYFPQFSEICGFTGPITCTAKIESYKYPFRVIYMLNHQDRLNLSAIQQDCYRVAKEHPCFGVGMSVEDERNKLRSMTRDPDEGHLANGMFSFDLEMYSQLLNEHVQRSYNEPWDELYDTDQFTASMELYGKNWMVVDEAGFMLKIQNVGIDKEGLCLFTNTFGEVGKCNLAVDLLRDAVKNSNLIRKATKIPSNLSLDFVAYIDDGAFSAALPKRYLEKSLLKVIAHLSFVARQLRGRFKLSACAPSDRYLVYKQRRIINGNMVPTPIKSSLKIGALEQLETDSLGRIFASLYTSTSGEVCSGMPEVVAYCVMCSMAVFHFKRFRVFNSLTPEGAARHFHYPLIGYSAPSPLILGNDTKTAQIAESFHVMKTHGRMDLTSCCVLPHMMINCLRDRKDETILANPVGCQLASKYTPMIMDRLSAEVESAIKVKADCGDINPVARKMFLSQHREDFMEYAKCMLDITERDSNRFLEFSLTEAYEATEYSQVVSFSTRLEKSATTRKILGREIYTKVIRQTREDALNFAKTFVQIIHEASDKPDFIRKAQTYLSTLTGLRGRTDKEFLQVSKI